MCVLRESTFANWEGAQDGASAIGVSIKEPNVPMTTRLWLSTPMVPYWLVARLVGAPLVYFSGWIGMFTGGTIWVLTHGHTVRRKLGASLPDLFAPVCSAWASGSLKPQIQIDTGSQHRGQLNLGFRWIPFESILGILYIHVCCVS